MQPFRLPAGGSIERARPLGFEFDGRRYQGCVGDTLASALLANGVHFVARSFKHHRPRGIYTAGVEEPNALVQLARGARSEPNVRATVQELYEGLVAVPQNCWPSLRFDIGVLADCCAGLIPAGFYYKTFMWPSGPRGWLRYEHHIRRHAGLGVAANQADPDHYEHCYAHCDVLVVGAGPAGLAAARAAAHAGARVVLCDENAVLGASLIGESATIDEGNGAQWSATVQRELAQHERVRLLPRTTAFGYYDGNLLGLSERVADHAAAPPPYVPRQRLWKLRTQAVVLATGAHERGLVYANNDLPGTMLAGAVRSYVVRYGLRPGTRAVVATTNDSAYTAALALHAAGVTVAAIADVRPADCLDGPMQEQVRSAGLSILPAATIQSAHGGCHVNSADIVALGDGTVHRVDCDLVALSGGWNPAVHLFSQARGQLRYDEALAAFVPHTNPLPVFPAGAANGRFDLAEVLMDGYGAGLAAARQAGHFATAPAAPIAAAMAMRPALPLWSAPTAKRRAKCFVDLQNDVTADDIALAAREGYTSVEHLKRYTTLGMGTDQGKTSNVLGLALLSEHLQQPLAAVGTTTFRPPYTPVALGAVAGHAVAASIEPTRYGALHDWHTEHGAGLVNAGLWKRPHSYPHPGETPDDAAAREAKNVRSNVGIVDVSTLGKIELQGKDVAAFLNRVYINRWDTLVVGRCRYGVMLREDGMVFDDGTTSRLAETHYLMTTTTVNATKVMQHLEYLLQTAWPELDVFLCPVTEQWTAVAVSGPRSRDTLAAIVDIDLANAAFPFLAVASCQVQTVAEVIPARILRMSYSGELAYEVHVPAAQGPALWEALLAAGEPYGIMPYGTEAMSTLRIEKGHIVIGAEADGRTTADDLGLGGLISKNKWCVGKPLLERAALVAPQRWQLVGLRTLDSAVMPRGAKLVADPAQAPPVPMQGQVTSWCWSPNLDAWIALGLLANGHARHGETIYAVSPLADASVRVEIGPPCFIDPAGERLRA